MLATTYLLFFFFLILYVKFYNIPCNESRDTNFTRILGKMEQQYPPPHTHTLKCIHVNISLLFLIIYILCIIFCATSFNRSQDIKILRILGKNTIAAPFSKLYLPKIISMSSLNVSILRIKF